jgi:hypothetical protein
LPLVYRSSDRQYKMHKGEGGNSQIIYVVCGKAIINDQRKDIHVEIIDGTSYTFDSNDCVLMYNKFRSLYGPDYLTTL